MPFAEANVLALDIKKALAAPELMVDIETLSTNKDAAILSIGAVIFDRNAQDTEETLRAAADRCRLFGPISFPSNEQHNRHISYDTLDWWFRQSDAAIKALVTGDIVSLQFALQDFSKWVHNYTPRIHRVWANSPSFDCEIMKNAMTATRTTWPFKFYEEQDMRTAKELAYPNGDAPLITVGVAHNALDDSIKQVLQLQHYTAVINGRIQVQNS